jgi:hypothetical protein
LKYIRPNEAEIALGIELKMVISLEKETAKKKLCKPATLISTMPALLTGSCL